MRRHLGKSYQVLLIALGVLSPAVVGQTTTGSIKTTGNCSPVVVQPKSGFEIICHDSTLSAGEALKQANQISALLSRLRGMAQDSSQMTKQLALIIEQLGKMSATTAGTQAKQALTSAPTHTIEVEQGKAAPDLSKGLTQRVLLDSDVVISAPRLPDLNKDETVTWTLFVDQDAVGEHKYTMDFLEGKTTWPGLTANMRGIYEFITEPNGSTVLRGVPIGSMLKPVVQAKK